MEYVWKQKPRASTELIEQLGRDINVNPILANMLINRGVESYETAKNYFRPSLSQLHDPFLMKDMKEAIDRIEIAVDQNEKILV